MSKNDTPKTCLGVLLDAAAVASAVQGLAKASIDPKVVEWLSRTRGRAPNAAERAKGVPANFRVKEVPRKKGKRVDKYFFAPDGTCFRSIIAVNRFLQAQKGDETDGAASQPSTPPTTNPVFRVYTNE